MAQLIWEGKEGKGRRRRSDHQVPLPLRAVEILCPNRSGPPGLSSGYSPPAMEARRDADWRNKLIWGDNQYAMASLLPAFAGKIDLIYIDPPFATGGNFSITIPLGEAKHTRKGSVIAERAYCDQWENGIDSYLQMMHDRLILMRDLLADTGSIYVHLDWHAGHYVKVLMDEIFGKENFRNEIVWCYRTMQTTKRGWARKHDVILFYTQGKRYVFNQNTVLEPYPADYQRRFRYTDEQGQRFMVRGKGGPFGFGQGDVSIEDEKKYPQFTYRQYMQNGSIPKDWWEIDMLNSNSRERVGYDTQKPEALLERILKASSNPGDLVADFFSGSGTTVVAAEKLGRRWIGMDLSRHAIHATRKRLLQIPGCQPFEILDLANYQKAKLKENGVHHPTEFILKLYGARPIFGHATLHGQKAGRMVHVADSGSAVSAPEINKVAKECASAEMKSVDILGWAFVPGITDLAHTIGSQHSVRIRLVQIPREALEVQPRDATRKPEVRFSALSRLEVEARWNHKTLTLTLKGFIPSDPEVLPQGLRGKVKHFSDFIDYWAVDFDYQAGGAFRPMWQSFRTRRSHRPETKCCHTYEQEGTYCVLIKVVDIFGNETTEWLDLNPSDSISQKGERKCRSRKEKVKELEICKRRS